MSPEPAITLGRTRAQAARAAFWLTLVGWGTLLMLGRSLLSPLSPLGIALRAAGIPVAGLLVMAGGAVAALALFGARRSVSTAERYTITPEGFQVEGAFGSYTLAWENIQAAEVTRTAALGIRVRDREAVLNAHQGTEQQREWLRTMEPWGEWDFLFPRAELGCPAGKALGLMAPHLRPQPAAEETPER